MKKVFKTALVLLVFVSIAYAIWSNSNQITSTSSIYPRYVLSEVEQFGNNSGKGNIIALSPYLHTYDFSSEQSFRNMMHYYLDFAKRKKLLNDSTIVLLPEYIGTWLVAANENKNVYTDTSLTDAMKTIVFSKVFKFGVAYLQAHSSDKTKEALFKMKADKMLAIYQNTFSALAKEFKITIVAGSVVLPNPSIKNGKIEIDNSGKLYNISVVFDTNGKALSPLCKKLFPINEEKTFTAAATSTEIPIYSTLAGNIAVLICADAWYPSVYEQLKNKNVSLLAVPSFVAGKNAWSEKWKGYDGAATPTDVDKKDINELTEQEAWYKYAMLGRIKTTGIKAGINLFLRGDLWNLGNDGQTLIWNNNMPIVSKTAIKKTGSLVNVWIE